MDDKETLIRVEQQLQDFTRDYIAMASDLKALFTKIENEAKCNASTQAELTTHVETGIVKKEENERRYLNIEDKLKELSSNLSKIEEELYKEISSIKVDIDEKLKNEIKNLKDQLDNKIVELEVLKSTWRTSLNFIKGIIVFIATVLTIFWPTIFFLLTKKVP
jgi:phage host-nuclease inhibitor protein Gam